MSESLEEFQEDFNGAPFDLSDFAEAAVDIEDCDAIAVAARDFLHAKEVFETTLEQYGIEVG